MKVNRNNIGLDIDGVICNFAKGFIDVAHEAGYSEYVPTHYTKIDHWDISPKFSEIMKPHWTSEKFWSELEPLRSSDLPFNPRCYITSRHVKNEVTATWLKRHGFPEAPVITVSHPDHKLAFIKLLGLDLFVDDLYKTVRQVIDAGERAVLYKAPYQVGHQEECSGLPIISTLEEIEYV